jgi:hypothetical protein
MNWLTRKVLKKLRKLHTRRYPEAHQKPDPKIDFTGQAASDRIKALLAADAPCMICRMGLGELRTIVTYLDVANPAPFLSKARDYITEKRDRFWWEDFIKTDLANFSGFFPATEEMLSRFSVEMLADTKYADLLGSWRQLENRLDGYFPPHLIRVPLPDLDSFLHKDPWSEVLAGKKVLVVHPFEESIQQQYAKRKQLFADQRVLPDFELKTLKAVQSLVGNKVEFPNWFAALDSMKAKMEKIDFDIALIGAGAYGFPLAAHAKKMERKGVHLGGATQLLFGIRGKRWDEDDVYRPFINEYWIRPMADEKPKDAERLEGGAYW